jgi:hypothetical protein
MDKLTKLKIKVIKKNALINYNMPVAAEKKSTRKAERQIATNVSGWINEFQHRRRKESKQAFSRLFALQN